MEREFYIEKEKIGNQFLMTLGDLFEEHYNYKKDKVKLTTLSNYGKKIKHFNSIKILNCIILRFKILKIGCKK